MTIKKIAFAGLLLSSVFLVACQPQEDTLETDTMMLEETPVVEDESIMMEGTDQAFPGEEAMMEEASPTAFPIMESETETEVETDTAL
ncbi:MAG: hypothetical protein QG639_403 [Patescibacteria group bacterium]|nr:hypothetical protein [Patescibacteria group bacterium]